MEQTVQNLTCYQMAITKKEREQLMGQKPFVLWFTGLSGAGKSTVANLVEQKLYERGKLTYLLDGDSVRLGLNRDLGFGKEARKENLRRVTEVAKLFEDASVITIVTFISPFEAERQLARDGIGSGYIEIFVSCDLDTCRQRDPKGLYAKAYRGEIKDFTGVSAEYEIPKTPHVIVDTTRTSAEVCAEQIISYLEHMGRLGGEGAYEV